MAGRHADGHDADRGHASNDLGAVDAALRTGKPLTIHQPPYPLDKLKPIVQGEAHQAVQAMLQSVGDPHSLDNLVLTGGGAHLFKKAAREALPQLKVKELSDPIYANARGLQLAGQDALESAGFPVSWAEVTANAIAEFDEFSAKTRA